MVAGLLVQVVLFSGPIADRVGALGPPVYVASTALVLVAVLANRSIRGMTIVALGAASNLAAIIANGGFMPASQAAMDALGKTDPTTYSNSDDRHGSRPRPAHRHLRPARLAPVRQRVQRGRRADRHRRDRRDRRGDALGAPRRTPDGRPAHARRELTRDRCPRATPPTGRGGRYRRVRAVQPPARHHRHRGHPSPARWIVQGKPVVRRGRKARDLRHETARPPIPWVPALPREGETREGEPGALHLGTHAAGVRGADGRCRDAVVVVMTTSDRIRPESGHRWG